MKSSNANPPAQKALDQHRGRAGRRSGTPGQTWTDESGNEATAPRTHVIGATVTETEVDDEDAVVLHIGGGIGDGTDGGVTDGDGTVTPVTTIQVPPGGFTDLGDGTILLNFLTNRLGEQHEVAVDAASGTSLTLDLSTANTFDVTLTGNCTFTLSNPPESGVEGRWTIVLRQDGTGSRTVTWPAAVQWRDTDGTATATAATLATAAGAVDTVVLTTLDGGTSYGASLENGSGSGFITEDTLETAGHYEVLMTGASPADPLEDGSGADWLYVWVP